MEIIKNQKEEGKIFVNKLSAAERQLAAAIRMYFMEEDPLAVHTVASAALNLFADLMKSRGKEPALYGVAYGLFRAARDIIEGELSLEDVAKWDDRGEGFEQIKNAIEFLKNNPDFDIEDIKVDGPNEFVRQFWSDKRKSYNFLKHADRDRSHLLDEAHVNNEDIIYQAIGNSLHLNCSLTSEKEYFVSSMFALELLDDPPADPMLIWILKQLSQEEIMTLARRNLCYSRVDDELDIDLEANRETATEMYLKRQKSKSGSPEVKAKGH